MSTYIWKFWVLLFPVFPFLQFHSYSHFHSIIIFTLYFQSGCKLCEDGSSLIPWRVFLQICNEKTICQVSNYHRFMIEAPLLSAVNSPQAQTGKSWQRTLSKPSLTVAVQKHEAEIILLITAVKKLILRNKGREGNSSQQLGELFRSSKQSNF